MENKILSLDLGTNSIGGSIRDLSDYENQFKKTTVITFETGVGKDDKGKFTISHAANRRNKRSIRRLYQARKYKLWSLLEILSKNKMYCPIEEASLKRWKGYNKEEAMKGNGGRKYPIDDLAFVQWIKLDFNNDGTPDYDSPYQLREELATVKLDFTNKENRHKLGRVLYHIAQHRGFKSSKNVQNKEDETAVNSNDSIEERIGAEGRRERKFWEEINRLGIEKKVTIGATLALVERTEKDNSRIRIRKELHQYVTRKLLIEEVKEIYTFQGLEFNELFGEPGKPVTIKQSSIFWQRPLRSQKGTVGKCTLEPAKYRCPASRMEFEEFRALCFINNIEYKLKGIENATWQQLDLPDRVALYNEKFYVQKDFEFIGISNWLKNRNKHDNWELNFNFKTNVSACAITARFKHIFGDDLKNLKIPHAVNQKRNEKKEYYDIEDIWHILFNYDDEDSVHEFATKSLGLDETNTKKFINLWYSMPVSYANLSLKAINSILPFLREGYIYTEATLLAKIPEVLGDDIWKGNKDFITKSLKQDVIEKNRDEKRLLNITNNLIAQYKSLHPDEKQGLNDSNYKIGEFEQKQITKACKESFGEITWNEKNEEVKNQIISKIASEYQEFFNSPGRSFKKLPHLLDSMKWFLIDNFESLHCENPISKKERCNGCKACKKINAIYHPSQISIYPPAKAKYYEDLGKEITLLGSPKTGAFKNPMVMRALNELKKYINYLIRTNQVDESTRIVVELARELNDTNKRWAIQTYQKRREEENKEFALAILELLKDPDASGALANPNNIDDIDKFRLWYEMIEDLEGYEKDQKFIENIKIPKIKKNKKGQEEGFEEFQENVYDKINKSLYFKLKQGKDNIIEKYKLWKEQQYHCLYTGEMIKITDLFKENVIDFEHTIPRSQSFDNSLANRTICYADFNRNVKKNQIPFNLSNYEEIKQRLEKWEQKVKDLELHVEFWKGKSKRAQIKEDKDSAIRQKHLWQFELDYWRDKVSRFTMKEITGGFKNSQIKDTQIISKYAMHYLKTFFNKVEVQKGEVTSEFRKIFGIQELHEQKDRSKHSHHAKDAIVLSLIPAPVIREQILVTWYKIHEQKQLLKADTEQDKKAIQDEISDLKDKLEKLINGCDLPDINKIIDKVDEQILINNITKNQTFTRANKRMRSRGKVVPLKDELRNIKYTHDTNGNLLQRKHNDGNLVWKNDEFGKPLLDKDGNKIPVYIPQEKWIKGDSIRGQLHLDTFYGKIKKVKRDTDGKIEKDENGRFLFVEKNEGLACVLRKEVDKNLNIDKIVDPHLKAIIEKQLNGRTIAATLKEDGGIWMLKKSGVRAHKIRHVRCYADDVTDPIGFKLQAFQGKDEHKNFYWANNGENVICALYQKTIKDKKGKEKIDREMEIISLNDAAALLSYGLVNNKGDIEIYRKDKKGKEIISDDIKERPYAVLKPGMKVIFYENNLGELKQSDSEDENDYKKRINYRMYYLVKFSGGQITFQHHLEARDDKKLKEFYPNEHVFTKDEKGKDVKYGVGGTSGFTRAVSDALIHNGYNNFEPWPRLLYSKNWLNMAIEQIHFEIKPDGEIEWNNK